MKKHLTKKKPCKVIFSNISQEDSITLLNNKQSVSIDCMKKQLKEQTEMLDKQKKEIFELKEKLKSPNKDITIEKGMTYGGIGISAISTISASWAYGRNNKKEEESNTAYRKTNK